MRHVLLAVVLMGCVAKGRHELVQVQLEATRTAMDTREQRSREALMDTEHKLHQLRDELSGREVQILALQERVAAAEAHADAQAVRHAESLLEGLEVCPPIPAPPPCPDCSEQPVERPSPPEEPPKVQERRALVQASVEEITEALMAVSHNRAIEMARTREQAHVAAVFQELADDGYAEILQVEGGTVVRILIAKLYNENTTSLSPLGEELVRRLADGLRKVPGQKITLIGHTDDQPVFSVEHPSNWERGFAYAVGVLRGLEYEGLDLHATVVSRAGHQPVAEGRDPEARRLNRRVEMLVEPDPAVLLRPIEPREPTPDGSNDGSNTEPAKPEPPSDPPAEKDPPG